MYKKLVYVLIFFCLLNGAVLAQESASAENEEEKKTVNFISIADIHFDPFLSCHKHNVRPCPLVKSLMRAKASEWPALFEKQASYSEYKQDSNYLLVKNVLVEAAKVAQEKNAVFILVLGDFLAHDYRNNYKIFSGDKSKAGYVAFVKKTFLFLSLELQRAFPNIDVYQVVGNNDSYAGDYVSQPHGEFFRDTAQIWAPLIKHNRASMLKTFSNAGYYALDLPIPNKRLIVLNDVMFSYKALGRGSHQAALQELDWLHEQLAAAKAKKQRVLIAMHIPVGVDLYVASRIYLFRLLGLWAPAYAQRFEAELLEFAPQVAGVFAGHLHSDWSHVLTFDDSKDEIPVFVTPAVSPILGNNPGFKLYTYSLPAFQAEDDDSYFYPDYVTKVLPKIDKK